VLSIPRQVQSKSIVTYTCAQVALLGRGQGGQADCISPDRAEHQPRLLGGRYTAGIALEPAAAVALGQAGAQPWLVVQVYRQYQRAGKQEGGS
jgi:hypothetical protein